MVTAFGVALTDEQLAGLWTADERCRLDSTHVVVVRDLASGLVEAFGPFTGPIEASVFAERYAREVASFLDGDMDVVVTPLGAGE